MLLNLMDPRPRGAPPRRLAVLGLLVAAGWLGCAGPRPETFACSQGAACTVAGSVDCPTLAACSGGDLTEARCTACQGLTCGQDAACDRAFPCVDGKVRVQGCCRDADCSGLTPFCGHYTGVNNVCVLDDAM